ncbi:hypothetical protein ACQCN7_23360 [Escherichia coli]
MTLEKEGGYHHHLLAEMSMNRIKTLRGFYLSIRGYNSQAGSDRNHQNANLGEVLGYVVQRPRNITSLLSGAILTAVSDSFKKSLMF